MPKSKTSKAAITRVIDQTEIELNKCWATLAAIKDGPYDDRYAHELIDFQSLLAPALFRLNESYLHLAQAKTLAISRKQKLSAQWFQNRMRSIAKYQEAITTVISIAKALGDSFAWIFYQRERELIARHLERERLDHTPPGIGGRGELEFIKQVKHIDGQLVLYHGITTFLRLGDISLVDLSTRTVTALGELKTKQVSKNQIQVVFECVSPNPFPKSKLPRTKDSRSKQSRSKQLYKSFHDQMPQGIKHKLEKQLKVMATSMFKRKFDQKMRIRDTFHYKELKALAETLEETSVAYQKTGDGLMLIGIRSKRATSLSARLLGSPRTNFNSLLRRLPNRARELVDHEQVGEWNPNRLLIGSLSREGMIGTIPIFWWPIPIGFLRKFFFLETYVMTLYNPAHLIKKLKRAGLEVELLPKFPHYKVTKNVRQSKLEMVGIDYFLGVIQTSLLSEGSVVDLFSIMVKKAEAGELPPYSKTSLQIQHFFQGEIN